METDQITFGCKRCWPEAAAAAGDAIQHMEINKALIQESHFSIKLRTCKICKQAFVSVFTERIDWQDGEDPQRWLFMPITPEEITRLSAQNSTSALERSIQRLAPNRKSLCLDHPKGHPEKIFWTRGIRIGMHD